MALGSLNLAAVLRTSPDQVVLPVGLNPAAGWVPAARLASGADCAGRRTVCPVVRHPVASGLLCADRDPVWGSRHAFLLASLFMAGMLLTDGINGLWIARLIARADQVAPCGFAGHGAGGVRDQPVGRLWCAKLLSPAVDARSEGKELIFGGAGVGHRAEFWLLCG